MDRILTRPVHDAHPISLSVKLPGLTGFEATKEIAQTAMTLKLMRSPRFQALLAKSRQSIKAGKGLSSDAFWKAVERRHR